MGTLFLWSPDDPVFMDVQENEVNVSETIAVEQVDTWTALLLPPPAPAVLTWEGQLPPQVAVAVAGPSLTVSAPDLMGMFPMTLTYLQRNGKLAVVTRWQDLAGDATEIVAYKPPGRGLIDIPFTVTASDARGSETFEYVIRVRANFNTGRDILIREVERRRRPHV